MASWGIDRALEMRNKYKVEAIVGHDMVGGSALYRVKWHGWPSSANTWEPIQNLEECKDLIKEFHQPCEGRRRVRRPRRFV